MSSHLAEVLEAGESRHQVFQACISALSAASKPVVLGDIATSGSVYRLGLAPLSEAAVAEMAGETDIDPHVLHSRTQGNPFFVTEILAAQADGIPETVRDAVLARAARLSRSTRAVLDAAAVIGPTISMSLLAEVTQADAGTVDECLSIGVLHSHPFGFAFRHELAREAVLAALPPHRKVNWHAVILDALERSGMGDNADLLATMAGHAEGAQDSDAVLR